VAPIGASGVSIAWSRQNSAQPCESWHRCHRGRLGGHQFCQEGLQVLVLYGQSVLETVAEVVGRRIDPGETSDPVYGSPAVGDEVYYNTGSSCEAMA